VLRVLTEGPGDADLLPRREIEVPVHPWVTAQSYVTRVPGHETKQISRFSLRIVKDARDGIVHVPR
jgi:hypothetical protein